MRLGSDPEVFLVDKKGKPTAICGMIGADKWNPLQVEGMQEGFTFQEDNVALEFGIPPASSAEEFISHIKSVQEAFLKRNKEFQFSKLSCIIFPKDQLQSPGAKIFGCEPDYNAWTGERNPKPNPRNKAMRSAGGHVHVETELDRRSVVKAMDLCLGVPSVLMDEQSDRKKLYGKAGACREKSYGVEYRTLSNFWIFHDDLIRWVWEGTETAIELVKSGFDFDYLEKDIVSCINKNDKEKSELLIKTFDLPFCFV